MPAPPVSKPAQPGKLKAESAMAPPTLDGKVPALPVSQPAQPGKAKTQLDLARPATSPYPEAFYTIKHKFEGVTPDALFKYMAVNGPKIKVAVIDVRDENPNQNGIQGRPDQALRNALHFPLTDSSELFSPAIEKANYMKHYPFVNVHSADMVIFHCEQSTTRGPRSAIAYLDAIKAAKEAKTLPASYNQSQRVTVLSGGWIALTKAVNANPQTLEKFLVKWEKGGPHPKTMESYPIASVGLRDISFVDRFN